MNNSDIENKVQEELEAFRSCCGFEIGGEMSVMCDIDDLDPSCLETFESSKAKLEVVERKLAEIHNVPYENIRDELFRLDTASQLPPAQGWRLVSSASGTPTIG